jgi:hypothetical protein
MSNALICYEDYLDTATRTVSSEDAAFPASNLYDQSVRGKVWRSAGYFLVTSSNNKIIFRETVGVDLTATLNATAYLSISSFMLGIKSALDTAGASTYTVTRDASNRIVITSDGLGGGGIFQLMWTDVLSTAADIIGFSTGSNDTGALTYTADSIRNHTEEFLSWDLGASSNPHALIVIGKKAQAIKLSESATIKLQGSLTSNFSSPAYEVTLIYDELAIIKLKASADTGLHTSALRYWRLSILDRENANGFVELSNVYLGEYYSPTQARIPFPLNQTGTDFSSSFRLESGSQSFMRRARTVAFNFSWFPLSTTEKERFDEIGEELGSSKPFYIIMDPGVVFGSSVSYSTRYVRFQNPLDCSLNIPNVWTSNWSVEEVI